MDEEGGAMQRAILVFCHFEYLRVQPLAAVLRTVPERELFNEVLGALVKFGVFHSHPLGDYMII